MSYPVFYPVEGTTLRIPFGSYDSAGASASLTGLAVTDIEIYKDGSTTQRASDAGYSLPDTDGIDFDGITGINAIAIDLSDNTTAGFYAVGSQYWVVVSSVTIDSQTVNFIAAVFEIVSATRRLGGTALPNAAADAAGGLPISDAGGLDLDAKLAATNEVTAARMGALTDWINGGRLDLILDDILLDTAEIGTAGAGLTAVTDDIAALPTAIENADALLDRDMATGTDSGSASVRTVRQALRFLRNKWAIAAGTLTVTKEDDATTSWTSAVTTTADAEPVTASDPAGP